jgi:hypothetical protein
LEAHRTLRNLKCFTSRPTLSPVNPIPGSLIVSTVKKKRELFSGPPPASRGSLTLPYRKGIRALVQEF